MVRVLYGGVGFPTGSIWWLGILHRICLVVMDSLLKISMVVKDSSKDLSGC